MNLRHNFYYFPDDNYFILGDLEGDFSVVLPSSSLHHFCMLYKLQFPPFYEFFHEGDYCVRHDVPDWIIEVMLTFLESETTLQHFLKLEDYNAVL